MLKNTNRTTVSVITAREATIKLQDKEKKNTIRSVAGNRHFFNFFISSHLGKDLLRNETVYIRNERRFKKKIVTYIYACKRDIKTWGHNIGNSLATSVSFGAKIFTSQPVRKQSLGHAHD